LQAYIFRPKGRGITPKLLLNINKSSYSVSGLCITMQMFSHRSFVFGCFRLLV
jgi:hypothetical protein